MVNVQAVSFSLSFHVCLGLNLLKDSVLLELAELTHEANRFLAHRGLRMSIPDVVSVRRALFDLDGVRSVAVFVGLLM